MFEHNLVSANYIVKPIIHD